MQAERDHLVRFVFPKLRQELLQRRIHLVDVDLRWGVTSEQDALSVCREIVDECRPRFLCMLGGRYGWVPPGKTRSITADEVHYGVLDRDLTSRGFAYFYFRDPSATAAMVEAAPGECREPAGSHGADALAELKTAITAAGLQPFIYRAQWDEQSRRLIRLNEFGDRVCADLKQSIDQEFGPATGEKPDEFTEENAAMEAFIEERVQRFVLGSRQPVWNELRQHAESTGGNGYLCLSGEAGSGKSALLGKFCQDYREAHPQDLVIPHFVGASPGSTDVRRTLRRLCHELVTGAALAAEIPEDPEKLRATFAEILQQASAKKRVVILLDAINQFDPTTQLAGLSWLPEELPATAGIILSTLSGPALDSLRQRRQPPRPVELQPLDAQDREAIIREFLHRYRKSMTDDQHAALSAKVDAGTPLYLLVALEELRTLGTYEEIADRIAQLPPDTRALFIWILKRLEDDDGFRDASGQKIGRELVSRFVSLMGASRHGLSQQELVELLSPGDPQGHVAALVQLLRPYLMQRGELLDFYHGQFREAVEQAYLESDDKKRKGHTELAEYLHAQNYWRESLEAQRQRAKRLPPTPRPANVRKVDELPWQRLREAQLSGQWGEVENLFTDPFFLEAKVEAGFIFELAGDFSAAVNVLHENRPCRRILQLLEEGIRRDMHFIARHPTTLFQCLWNSCWWYDCPDAELHYDPPVGGWPRHGLPWKQPGAKLSNVLDAWRAYRLQAGLTSHWLRSLRPPIVPLGVGQTSVFHGHTNDVSSIVFFTDGQKLVSGSSDGTLCVWSMQTGAVLLKRRFEQDVSCLAVDSHNNTVVVGLGSGAVHICRAQDLTDRAVLHAHPNRVRSVALAPGGKVLATSSDEKTVRLWSMDTLQEVQRLDGHQDAVMCLAFARNGDYLVSGSKDMSVALHDCATGRPLKGWQACKRDSNRFTQWGVNSLSLSADERFLVTGGGDGAVRIWALETGLQVREFNPAAKWSVSGISGVAFSPDGQRVAAATDDGTLYVWEIESGSEVASSRLPISGGEIIMIVIKAIAFIPHGERIAAACGDGTIRFWNRDSMISPGRLRGHHDSGGIQKCKLMYSPDGSRLITQVAQSIWLWDINTGRPLTLIHGDTQQSLLLRQARFSADGKSILVFTPGISGADRLIEVRDVATGDVQPKAHNLQPAKDNESPTIVYPYHSSLSWNSFTGESVVKDDKTDETQSWFPDRLIAFAPHPAVPIWVGLVGANLLFLKLDTDYFSEQKNVSHPSPPPRTKPWWKFW